MRIVAGEARQVNLSSTITASGSQTTLAAVPTTMAVPAGGTLIDYAGELTAPAGSAAALDDATIRNPTFTPDVPGLYTVAITATDTVSGATLTLVRTQEVVSELSIALTADSSQDTLNAVATTTTPTGGLGAIAYSTTLLLPDRTSGSVSGGTTTTPSFTPTIAGIYVLTVTATDAAGQTATATRKVLVGTAAFTISLSATSGTQDTLNAVSTTVTPSGAVGSVTYSAALAKPSTSSASVSGGTTTTPSFTPDKVGGYTLVVTATDAAGREAKATRYLQVGTAALSVSIAAISNQTTPTGTINCDSTVTGAVGSVVYAWTGTKSDGTAVSFSDATAADPAVTLSINDRPGVYTVAVTVTDAAGRTATATRTFRVGTSTGWVTSYNHDFTADANSTISASPWTDADGGSWGVENIANSSTFAVQNGTGLVIVSSAGDLVSATRTCPLLTRALTNMAPSYAANRRLLAMMQIGTGSTIAASQHSSGMHFEGASSPLGVAGTTDRGGGVYWRNNAGTLQVAGVSRGNTTTGFQQAAKPATETAPRVLAFERAGWSVRVGYSTNTAAYGDPDHASWVWSESFGVDYISTASKLDPATDLLAIHCRKGAGAGSPTLVLEKLAMLVRW